jgi:hypothetical protein
MGVIIEVSNNLAGIGLRPELAINRVRKNRNVASMRAS